MNPRRRRQQKALVKELKQGVVAEEVLEVLEPEALTPVVEVPVPEPVVSQAEIRHQENVASEQGVELEVVVGEETIELEEIDMSDVAVETTGQK